MSKVIDRHGFTIQVTPIAQGIWDMMPEDDRLPMVIGMIPLAWKEMVEKSLREKLDGEYAARFGYRPKDSDRFCDDTGETYGAFIASIIHVWASELLGCAQRAGVLVV